MELFCMVHAHTRSISTVYSLVSVTEKKQEHAVMNGEETQACMAVPVCDRFKTTHKHVHENKPDIL